jgi:uncharacterized RDD family membrane protein YckC
MSGQAQPLRAGRRDRLRALIGPAADVHGQYAGFASRGLAWAIDLALVAVITLAAFWVIRSTLAILNIRLDECTRFVPVTDLASLIHNACRTVRGAEYVVGASLPPVYFFVLWLLGGQTVGQGIAGVKVVAVGGGRVTAAMALLRLVGYALSIIPFGIGFLCCLWDDRRQGWHDKLAGTCVIYWRRSRVTELVRQ